LEERFFAFLRLVSHPFLAAAERELLVDLRELLDFLVLLPLDFFELLLDLRLLPEDDDFFLPFAPPVFLFTVAQPMRSASFSLPPRERTLSSMCSAMRRCLPL
jgi:hypothetical protein